MNFADQQRALSCAVKAARAAGGLMRRNLNLFKKINSSSQHDIKLDLDVRCQKLIEKTLRAGFPTVAVLGEEGISGNPNAEERWVVDPIDGTVNFTYGIPHACVSIALQVRPPKPATKPGKQQKAEYQTLVGVVYDPFCDELWTAIRAKPARLNGKVIHVSRRRKVSEAIVSMGFAKSRDHLEHTLPHFNLLVRRVRKVRMMGAAALAMTYVASGRFDAYVETGIRLWDIAAGGLIVECAGGEFWHEPVEGEYTYRMFTSNGLLRKKLQAYE
ncbi:MAG: Inositol-monophosphatase [Pedosphaera sp.]|nr:Inositol-monophosphatase [Pedosphaera sp.]